MNVGLIFYPGALVQAEAYVPLARAVAEAGYVVSIMKQPFQIGWIGPNWRKVVARTQRGIDLGPPERRWIIGGHSRSGQLATSLVREHPGLATGLLLIGTSHPREDDMSDLQIDVTKVFGSEDGLASEEEVKQFAKNLPPDTHFVRIAGANHSQ